MNDSSKLVKEIDSFFFTNFHLFDMNIFASTLGQDCTLAIPHYIHVYISLPFIHLNENIFYIFDILSIINLTLSLPVSIMETSNVGLTCESVNEIL